MKFTEGKTSVDCFRNSFRIAGTWNFLLMTCILQTEKKLVVQVFDRILKKFAVVGKTLEKLFQQIVIAANQGEPLSGKNSQAEEEYRNICRRLLGEEVPFAELRSKKGMFQRIGDFFRK